MYAHYNRGETGVRRFFSKIARNPDVLFLFYIIYRLWILLCHEFLDVPVDTQDCPVNANAIHKRHNEHNGNKDRQDGANNKK